MTAQMATSAKRETVGKRLKRLRTEQGKSQRDIQSKRVSYAYISRIENGERNPSLKALRDLAEKLGVTALYLETGQEIYCPHCETYWSERGE